MSSNNDDLVWRALSSPIRRRMLDLIREKRRTTGELDKVFKDLSRYAVMQHLGVLAEANLVIVEREGRTRWNMLNAAPLQMAFERFVTPYQSLWAGKMTDFKRRAEALSKRRANENSPAHPEQPGSGDGSNEDGI